MRPRLRGPRLVQYEARQAAERARERNAALIRAVHAASLPRPAAGDGQAAQAKQEPTGMAIPAGSTTQDLMQEASGGCYVNDKR